MSGVKGSLMIPTIDLYSNAFYMYFSDDIYNNVL